MSVLSISIDLPPFLKAPGLAVCRDHVYDFDFAAERPPKLASERTYHDLAIANAKAACRICPLSASCLAYGLAHKNEVGIWGGLDEDERTARRG